MTAAPTRAARVRHVLYLLAHRQVSQTATALCLVLLALLATFSLMLLKRGIVYSARMLELPIGHGAALGLQVSFVMAACEELLIASMRRRAAPRPPGRTVGIMLAVWACCIGFVTARQTHSLDRYGMLVASVVFATADPLARLLRKWRRGLCHARRLLRMLRNMLIKVVVLACGALGLAYPVLTLSLDTQQTGPWFEVVVMGLAFPIVQMACMSVVAVTFGSTLSRVMRQAMKTSTQTTTAAAETSASVLEAYGVEEIDSEHARELERELERKLKLQLETSDEQVAEEEEEANDGQRKDRKKRKKRTPGQLKRRMTEAEKHAWRQARARQRFMPGVLLVELLFSLVGFASLFMAETEEAFSISVVTMLCIELAEVAVKVRTRSVIATVVNKSTALAMVGSNSRIRKWLLYQELGEKGGLLLAAGFLALCKAMEPNVAVLQALDLGVLARRAAFAFSAELLSDIGKDLLSMRLGIPTTASTRVPLPALLLAHLTAGAAAWTLVLQLAFTLVELTSPP